MTAIRRRISTPASGVRGSPATVADPADGAISVRTMVVLPAPLGPRNPKTSPRSTSKDTSSNAMRSPNRFERWWTASACSGRVAWAGAESVVMRERRRCVDAQRRIDASRSPTRPRSARTNGVTRCTKQKQVRRAMPDSISGWIRGARPRPSGSPSSGTSRSHRGDGGLDDPSRFQRRGVPKPDS